MGNACFCSKNHLIRDIKVDICLDRESFNLATEQVLINEDNMEEKHGKGILELKKYFDENEKEILNNLNKREKAKKIFRNKKGESRIGMMNDNYELMLKRLLEQKNIIRNGPKRRETIRQEDRIKILVVSVLLLQKK